MNSDNAQYLYEMYRCWCVSEDIGHYVSYGVRVVFCPSDFILREIDDVCFDPDALRPLVELCNTLELEPCHLTDVIEDWLS